MSVATKVKVGGVWKDVPDIQFRSGGVWKQVTDGLIKVGGVWKHFFQYGGGPTVSITNPTEVSVINVDDVVSIQVTATDTDGIERVNFYVQGPEDVGYSLLGDDLTAPFTKNWTPNVAGEWNIKAEAVDNVGLKGYAYVTVVVLEPTNIDPVASITSPAPNAAFVAGDQVTINVTATDADGTVTKVKFYADGNHIGNDTTGVADVFSLTWTAVEGVTELSAIAIDNQGGQSTPATKAITVAATPSAPTCEITSPLEGASYNEGNTVTVQFDYADVDGDASQYKVWLNSVVYTDWTALGGSGASGSKSVSVTPTGSGDFVIGIQVKDAGNRESTIDYVGVVFNALNAPPGGTIITPSQGAVLEPTGTIRLQIETSDGDGTVTEVYFRIRGNYQNGNSYYSAMYTAAFNAQTGYWEYDAPVPTFSGSFVAMAWIVDDQGASTYADATFATNAKPTITAVQDKSIASGTGTTFTVYSYHNHVDFNSNVSSDTHTISFEGLPAGATTGTVQNGNEFVTTITIQSGTAIGTYNMKLKVEDSAWPVVEEGFILVVAQADTAPTVTLAVDESNPKQAQEVTFSATPSDPEGKLVYVELQRETSPGVWQTVGSYTEAPGQYFTNGVAKTFPVTWEDIGAYTYRARAKDEANNWGTSATVTLTVKTDYSPTYGGSTRFVFPVGGGGTISFYVNNPDKDDSAITISAATTSLLASVQSIANSLQTVYEPANDRYACTMTVPSNVPASVGNHPIEITMDDGYNPPVKQFIEVKSNAAPYIFVGALSADLGERTTGVPGEWIIPMGDDNGSTDINDGTLTVTNKPASITASIVSSNGGVSKVLKIEWDGTDPGDTELVFNVKVQDMEGAWSNDIQLSLSILDAVDADLTSTGPTALTIKHSVDSFITLTWEDPDGDNITDVSYTLSPGLQILGVQLTVYRFYYSGGLWYQGVPPTPESSKRRISFQLKPLAGSMNSNPNSITVTATDHIGREFTHVITITVTP